MSKKQRGIQLTLTLLVGMFILGGTLLNTSIGQAEKLNLDVDEDGVIDVVVTLKTDTIINTKVHGNKAKPEDFATYSITPPSWDIATMSGSLSLHGTRIDDEGNTIGSVSVSGGVSLSLVNNHVYSYYYAYAASSVSLGDYTGKGNPWVEVPGNSRVYHAYGPGDYWMSGNHQMDARLSATDSNTIVEHIQDFFDNLGNKTMKASATLSMDGVRIKVGFEAQGQ